MPRSPSSRPPRRGSALLLVLVVTVAIVALAGSAIVMTSNASLLTRQYDREREFRYAAEAALAMGKSRLRNDPYALPDSGYTALASNATITGADGEALPRLTVNIYAGRTGNNTGQFGRFVSLVAEVKDPTGTRFVRRLELAEENFARYAYWTDRERTSGGSTIYFGGGDVLYGPVWSNDDISIASSGATFHEDVGTAGDINGKEYGTFKRGYREQAARVSMPTTMQLSRLASYASASGFSFAAPNRGGVNQVLSRIEFVAMDLDASGDSTGDREGFFRVYRSPPGKERWVRGDFVPENCGDFHNVGGRPKFFPAAVHRNTETWFKNLLIANGMSSTNATNEIGKTFSNVMAGGNARCFPGGDPHLVAVERQGAPGYTVLDWQKGGDDTTFTPVGSQGQWIRYSVTPNAAVVARRGPIAAQYFFPLSRALNSATKGVIHIGGSIAVNGVLRGQVTLYAEGSIVIADDLRYASDPGSGRCADMLGIIAADDVVIPDNGIATPQEVGGVQRTFDDSPGLYLHGIVMTLDKSFTVENYGGGPRDGTLCDDVEWGRGCLYLTGGLIQQERGPVGTTGGTGFLKRYSYDRCALRIPPPYFPTTGRMLDNAYSEVDPGKFDVARLFELLTPN